MPGHLTFGKDIRQTWEMQTHEMFSEYYVVNAALIQSSLPYLRPYGWHRTCITHLRIILLFSIQMSAFCVLRIFDPHYVVLRIAYSVCLHFSLQVNAQHAMCARSRRRHVCDHGRGCSTRACAVGTRADRAHLAFDGCKWSLPLQHLRALASPYAPANLHSPSSGCFGRQSP